MAIIASDQLILPLERQRIMPPEEGDKIIETHSSIAELQWRVDNYANESGFPRTLFISEDGRIVGTWFLGNNYRAKSKYYGEYPPNYLRRIKSLFPDKRKTLHLFSGKVDLNAFPGDTVDINPTLDPTYIDDAQTLEKVPLEKYDLILADPPYTGEDAERYGTTMIRRNDVMRALQRLRPGAHIAWLDQTLPMYRKDAFAIEGAIGVMRSTNHRFRLVSIFRRLAAPELKAPELEKAT
jgi:hypothetical protein